MFEVSGFKLDGEKFFIPTDTITAAIAEVFSIQNKLVGYQSYRLTQLNPMTQSCDVVCEWSRK